MDLSRSRRGRRLLFAVLYLSEGAAIGFIGWALPTKLRLAGMSIQDVTSLVSLLILPWVFKFLWAPAIDVLRTRRWGYRHWIISAQILMGLFLLPLVVLDWRNFSLIFGFLFGHAMAAATQDAAIDGWAVNITPQSERGTVSGWMKVGTQLGRWVFGAGGLLLGNRVGDKLAVLLLAAIIAGTSIVVLFSSEGFNRPPGRTVGRALESFVAALRAILSRRQTWLGLLFAVTAGAGFESVTGIVGPFLVDRGFAAPQVGQFYTASTAVLLVGALAGGFISDRLGHVRATAIFLVLVSATIVVTAAFVTPGPGHSNSVIVALLITLYLGIGLFTASAYALYMHLTDPRLGATQFSAFMAATNGCESWSTFAIGRLIALGGYPRAFVVMAGISLLGLPLLALLSRTEQPSEAAAGELPEAERAVGVGERP